MHITWKDFKRYILFSLIFVWVILLAHLFYVYLEKQSTPVPVKWWILLEWAVVSNIINPFPYIANNYYSKYVQSLLFRSCLNDLWKPDLCEVKTDDRKTFIVSITGDNYWSDGRKITADDVYFTYFQVIQNNSLNLDNPIPNTLEKIEKISPNQVKVVFKDTTVNNWSFFKNPILPKHILEGATKDFYVLDFTKDFVNSTCVKIDPASDFKTKIVLDYKNCKDYYIDKYQFNLVKNTKELQKYLTGSTQVDIYNWYENLSPEKFKKFDILLDTRYALFWNTLKQTNPTIKAYLSNLILSGLKQDLVLSNRLAFNGYGLFVLPKVNLNKQKFKQLVLKDLFKKAQQNYANQLIQVDKDYFNYKSGANQFYIPTKKDKILIYGSLLTGYEKIWVVANSGNTYILKTYIPYSKQFKYALSEKFKNLRTWKNTYKIIGFEWTGSQLIDTITVFYKKIDYPKFDIKAPDFTVVYLDNWLNSLIGDQVVKILQQVYPGNVEGKKVWFKEYQEILNSKKYDLVVGNVNFAGKDISYMFLSKDPVSNPSNFVNPNFASLIKQDLLAPVNLKKKIFAQLNEIYQKAIPVVFIWNEKMGLFVQKKYNVPNLDYSYFTNRKEMLKNIILTKIKKPVVENASLKGFVDFLKESISK